MSRLRSALLLVRDVDRSRKFFETGLKLSVLASAPNQILLGHAEGRGADLVIQAVPAGQAC